MARGLVVGAVIVDSLATPTEVLAARRSRPADLVGFWEFPGGKVEPGEEPAQALVREVTEELGVELRLGEELSHPDGSWPISESHALRLFLAEIVDGELHPGDSHDEVSWLAAAELRSVTWLPADDAALDAVAARLSGADTVSSMQMRLELVPIPTTDVDRTKEFYVDKVGFALDHDVQPGNGMRVVQLTPPGSACSIAFGTGFSDPDGPRVQNLHLVVDDIVDARAHLTRNGVDVSDVQDMGGVKYAFFADPDGNSWALQELLR